MTTEFVSRARRIDDAGRQDSLSAYFRRKRDVRLRSLIETLHEGRKIEILDLGGTVEYWGRVGVPFLRRHVARITVMNLGEPVVNSDTDLFQGVSGDACELGAFATGSVSLVHSNSVIEHVGDWSRVRAFAEETRRVGRSYYVQTPNFWFPVDPHYYSAPMIHWMPRPWQADLLMRFPICAAGRASTLSDALEILDSTRLLDSRQFRLLFPDAQVSFEWLAGLQKSLVAIRR